MSTVLRDDPLHHRPLAPASHIGSEGIRAFHAMLNGQFLGPCEIGKQGSHRQVRSAEPVSGKIGTAVGQLTVKPVQLSFQL